MKIKVGINGMGRIGRMILRSIIENNNNIEIKHINNRSSSEACSNLLKYDSIHGKFNAEVDFDSNHLVINKNKISFSQETDLDNINWKKFDVDYVFECTGKFNSKDKLLPHLKNGAKKVIVSAPCKNADKTIVFGVNEADLKKEDDIISAASCTTNCLAPVAHVLNKNFEIEKAFMTTIHAFTSDQRILDNSPCLTVKEVGFTAVNQCALPSAPFMERSLIKLLVTSFRTIMSLMECSKFDRE